MGCAVLVAATAAVVSVWKGIEYLIERAKAIAKLKEEINQ